MREEGGKCDVGKGVIMEDTLFWAGGSKFFGLNHAEACAFGGWGCLPPLGRLVRWASVSCTRIE